jgi:hypothetical protein
MATEKAASSENIWALLCFAEMMHQKGKSRNEERAENLTYGTDSKKRKTKLMFF